MDRNGKKEKPKSEIKDIFREVTRQIVEQTVNKKLIKFAGILWNFKTRTRFNSALFADDSSDAELSVSYSDIEEEPESSEPSLTESGRLSTTRRSYRLARAAKNKDSPSKSKLNLNQTHPLAESSTGDVSRSKTLEISVSSPVKSEKSVKEKFKDAKKAVSKRLGFSNNHKNGSSSKSSSAPLTPEVNKSADTKVKSGARVTEIHQASGNTDKKRLGDIVQRTISRHQSR